MENQAEYEMSVETAPNKLIALALEKQADPGTLEKLMDLQERWERGQAQKAFVKSMSAFKQEAPSVLIKGDRVDFTTQKGRTSYNYANLGSIVQEISSLLGKHDLSASWNTGQDEKGNVVVTCNITHVAGHRESVTLKGPVDQSGNKNPIQAIGSTVTYLQRYTLLAALGLATGEDDDGRGGPESPKRESAPNEKPTASPDKSMSDKQRKMLWAKMMEKKMSKESASAFFKSVDPKTSADASAFIENFDAKLKEFQDKGEKAEVKPVTCPEDGSECTLEKKECCNAPCAAWD